VLAGAWAFREVALRKPTTVKVEVVMVIDTATRIATIEQNGRATYSIQGD